MENGVWRSLGLLNALEPLVPGQADLLPLLDATRTGSCDCLKTGENYGPVSCVVHPTHTDSSLLARHLKNHTSPVL